MILTKEVAADLRANLPKEELADHIHHTFWYRDGDLGLILKDAVRKMNHSSTPNVHTVYNKAH